MLQKQQTSNIHVNNSMSKVLVLHSVRYQALSFHYVQIWETIVVEELNFHNVHCPELTFQSKHISS